MKKNDIVERITMDTTYEKCRVENVVDAFIETLQASLKRGEEIHLHGFGTFRVKERKARVVTNPRTREKKSIPAKKGLHFKPSKSIINYLNDAQ